MTPSFSNSPIAHDAYEARIEHEITKASDLYELDGETFMRNVGGCIETFGWEVDQ
jgi:hypothetical protein